jgi:hypothetical protein
VSSVVVQVVCFEPSCLYFLSRLLCLYFSAIAEIQVGRLETLRPARDPRQLLHYTLAYSPSSRRRFAPTWFLGAATRWLDNSTFAGRKIQQPWNRLGRDVIDAPLLATAQLPTVARRIAIRSSPSLDINLERPRTPTSRTRVSGGITSAPLHYPAHHSLLGHATPCT